MRSRKRAPTHPGRILNSHYLEPLSLTITELARTLGVSRKTLSLRYDAGIVVKLTTEL
jgi:addiction module HigA family antidote